MAAASSPFPALTRGGTPRTAPQSPTALALPPPPQRLHTAGGAAERRSSHASRASMGSAASPRPGTRSARRHQGSLSAIDTLLQQSRALRTELHSKRRALLAAYDEDNVAHEKELAACPPTQAAIDAAKEDALIKANLVPGGARRAKARAAAARGPTPAELAALEREVKRTAQKRERAAREARARTLETTAGSLGGTSTGFRGYYVPELHKVRSDSSSAPGPVFGCVCVCVCVCVLCMCARCFACVCVCVGRDGETLTVCIASHGMAWHRIASHRIISHRINATGCSWTWHRCG